jgi:hypothetical protein
MTLFEPTNDVRAWPKPVQLVALHGTRQVMVRDETGIVFIVQLSDLLPLERKPYVYLDAASGSVEELVNDDTGTFTRNSPARAWNGTEFVEYAANTFALEYDEARDEWFVLFEPEATNQFPNNTHVGATPGLFATTRPTGWVPAPPNAAWGMEVVGTGTDKGIPYIDIRINTESAPANALFISPTGNSATVAAPNENWCVSGWFAALSGVDQSWSAEWYFAQRRANGTSVGTGNGLRLDKRLKTAIERRTSYVAFTSNAETERISMGLNLRFTTGAAYDFSFRLAGLQMERNAIAPSSLILTDTSGPAVRAACAWDVALSEPVRNGTVYAVSKAEFGKQPGSVVGLSDGTTDNQAVVRVNSNDQIESEVISDGASVETLAKDASSFTELKTKVQAFSLGNAATGLKIGSAEGQGAADTRIQKVLVFKAPLTLAQQNTLDVRQQLNVFLVGGQSNADGSGASLFGTRNNVWEHFGNTNIPGLIPQVTAWNGTTLRPYLLTDVGPNGCGRRFISGTVGQAYSQFHVACDLIGRVLPNVATCWITEGGVSLTGIGGSGNFNPDISQGGTVPLYGALQTRYETLAAYCLANNIDLIPRAFFWHQGEGDSSATQALYLSKFTDLINGVRGFTGAPTLPVIYGTTAVSGPAQIRAAHLEYEASDPNAWCRINDDLTVVGDLVHFDEQAVRVFGEWCYQTFVDNYL